MKNPLLLFAVIILFSACKAKEEVIPNRPPNAFTVTPTLKSDGKTIVLNWTKAKDPDGDVVSYTVVLKDTLAKNISDTTYTIASLDFNYSQAGKVIAKDAKGLISEASFTATTKAVTFVNIPDANFEKFLIYRKIDKDSIVNGRMNIENAKGVTEIYISNNAIKSLTGIEAFTNLQTLYCPNNQLTVLDITKNINLQSLSCPNNQITTLDVSKNINLQSLYCGANQLTVLDVSKNINLQSLWCYNNQLTVLDITKNINLQSLSCFYNQLTALNIDKNIDLQYLYCHHNQITTLTVSKNIKLEEFGCDSNQLTVLDVSKNINLQIFRFTYNQLTVLDVSKNMVLQALYCYNNQLIDLKLSENNNLQKLDCRNNQIKTICVADVEKASANTDWQKDPTATYEVCK